MITLFGALFLLVGAAGPEVLREIEPSLGIDAEAAATVLFAVGLLLLVIGILEIVAAVGIFVHKTWGRWLGVVLGSVGLVLGFLLLLITIVPPGGTPIELAIDFIWLGAHAFVVAALAASGRHFQVAYPGR